MTSPLIPAHEQAWIERGLWTQERIADLLDGAAQRFGDKQFLTLGQTRLSFLELRDWVARVAAWLREGGLRPGERVLIQAGNCVEVIVAQLAVWRIEAVAVPVIPIYRAHEMGAILDATTPAVVVSSLREGARSPAAELEDLLPGRSTRAPRQVLIGGERRGWEPFPGRGLIPAAPPALPGAGAAPDACAAILFTSGTTALPKGAMISGRALLANLANWRTTWELDTGAVLLCGAPLAHIGGMLAVLVPLSAGGRAVILPRWDGDAAVAAIEAERVTFMSGAAVFLADLVQRYEAGASPGYRLPVFTSGGAATAPSLIERAQVVGVTAGRCYGMTETAGTVAASRHTDPLEIRAHTDGEVLPGVQIRILDARGAPLPGGQVGQIHLRSPQLMLGYTDAAVTRSQLDADGWFDTGDLGMLGSAGHLTMVGRTKDIINRGGEKFSCADIEAALLSHPAIREAAVLGLPDERLGEVVAAVVVLTDGTQWTGPGDVLAHLELTGLARPKFPVAWFLREELPRTASGKVRKNVLAESTATAGPLP
ncbi:MAG: class I adenylate-forming enzyme family protein [Sporichthyaceae bacterium]